MFYAFVFTSLLVLAQLIEHTDPRYSALVFCFFMLSVFAFNVAGGLSRASGAYIFFFSALGVDVGTVYKAVLGQPAQSNLQQPLLLMSAHIGVMAGMLLAVYLTRKLVKTKDGMAAVLNVYTINYSESAIGCLALWIIMTQILPALPGGGGQLLHSLNLVNQFFPLAIFLATIGAVRDSGGRRSTTPLTLICLGYTFIEGLLSFSKQGMFTPVVCWMIGAAWARFRLRPFHIIFLIVFAIYAQLVLAPLSELRDEGWSSPDRVAFVEHYLTHYSDLKKRSHDWQPASDLDWRMFYYGSPQGIWDRLSMLPNDSVLVSFSDQGHYFGLKGIEYYFENLIPHIVMPHKLQGVRIGGNAYMHEMGELADADTTTGISFSPTAELYHLGGWFAILVIAPPIFFLLFATNDAICGDLRRQPWGLGLVLIYAHTAPEVGIGGAIVSISYGNVGTIMAIFACGYITPLIGSVLSGRGQVENRRRAAPSPRQLQAGRLRTT